MLDVYGLTHCSTVRKATRWLDAHGVAYTVIDYRQPDVIARMAPEWLDKAGWEALVNRRSTTWRTLDAITREPATPAQALTTLIAHPSLIRRPLIMHNGRIRSLGFDADTFAACYGT